jgi:TetR/AcrR family transcriptional repressor of nem operon
MSSDTKQRILEAAEPLMVAKSFHALGLNELLTAADVPKGSFYHYFKSKEDFGVELIRHYTQEKSAPARAALAGKDAKGDPLARLLEYYNALISYQHQKDCRSCCLAVKLSLEVSNFSEPMRAVLAEAMRLWREAFERVIVEGQEAGTIRRDLEPASTAALLQDTWQGALQRVQVERSVAPLRAAVIFFKKHLTAAPL